MISGLPLYETGPMLNQCFSILGRQHLLGETGRETLRLLSEIDQLARSDVGGFWALRSRPQLSQLRKLRRPSVITLVILHTRDQRLRKIAIWVRGHLTGMLGASVLGEYLHSSDAELRKVTVRALKRMNVCSDLPEVAKSDPNPRIRRIAQLRPARPFGERINKFKRNVHARATETKEQPLFISPSVTMRDGRPAKSSSLIQRILHRIRRLVRQSHVAR